MLLFYPSISNPPASYAAEYITDTDHGGADWTLANGDVIAGNHTNIGTFTVPAGATVTVKDYDGANYGTAYISATTVDIQGIIEANGRGFRGVAGSTGEGPGGGYASGSNWGGGGAAHGGDGSNGNGAATQTTTYGSLTAPVTMGSAGGGASGGLTGGDGGGAVRITAVGTMTVAGTIRANGNNSTSRPAGGSGGSIYLIADTLTGAGSITANGGSCGPDCQGGAGGGGRIAIHYTTSNGLSGTVTANKGTSSYGTTHVNGTVVYIDDTNNDLYIKNTQTWKASPSLEGSTHTYNDITVSDNSTWTIQGYYTDNNDGVGITLNVNDFTLGAGSSINANGKGYRGGAIGSAGEGTGGGKYGGWGGGGAAYGGDGSSGNGTGSQTSTYGSLTAPTNLGSGGGGSTSGTSQGAGGNGGGAVTLNASGTITITGGIAANGNNGTGRAGGGAGGSIYLVAGTVTGAGSITANGGSCGSDCQGGGGGGGRIAVHYITSNGLSGTITANKGASSYASGSGRENGTVIYIDDTNNNLYIKNTQTWKANPSLEGSSHTYNDVTVSDSSTWTIQGYYTDNNDGVGITFNANDFTLGSGSSVNVAGGGFRGGAIGAAGDGPGGGGYGGWGGGGAAHGGDGSSGNGTGGQTNTYGSLTAPTNLGSGGGGSTSGTSQGAGGNGGGAVTLNASGTITITGGIAANGNNGTGRAGGGAGGSIYLVAGTVTGAGSITANGGSCGSDCQGGGGGGGRIAIKYTISNVLSGTITVNKGTNSWGATHTDGTLLTQGLPSVSSLAQYKSDGSTGIATSATTNETTVVLKMSMSDGDSADTLTPEVEVRALGTAFSDSATNTGDGVAYSGTPVTGSVTVSSLADNTSFHWQARVCDGDSNCTSWASYGGNSEDAIDFRVVTNTAPYTPASLGSTSYVDGSWVNDNTPTLTFTLSDPDASDTVKYQIQIDDDSDFSSVVVDYTSALATQGADSFTVGQAEGSGTYTTGSSGQTLSDTSYYWRVKTIDDASSESSYETANSGSIAFKLDATAPSDTGTPSTTDPTSDNTPTWTWTVSSDASSGLASTPYTVEWCTNSSFSGCSSYTSTSSTNSFTHSTSLADGTWYFRVIAEDTAGNQSNYSGNSSVTIDTTGPASIDLISPENDEYINNLRPTFKWKTSSDSGSGLSKYKLEINNGDEGGFTIDNIEVSRTDLYENNKYKITYEGFNDNDSNNNYISVYTKSSSDWSSSENYGELNEGNRSWRVVAEDSAGNESSNERHVMVDRTNPAFSDIAVSGSRNFFKISGKLKDTKNGSKTNKSDYIRSNPKNIEVVIKRSSVLLSEEVARLNLDFSSVCDYSLTEWDTLSCSFDENINASYGIGDFEVSLYGYDYAGNTASYQELIATYIEVSQTPPSPTPTGSPKPSASPEISPSPKPILENLEVVNATSKVIERLLDNTLAVINEIVNTPKLVVELISGIVGNFGNITSKFVNRIELLIATIIPGQRTQITNIEVVEVSDSYAVITWKTNHPATSKVNYGENKELSQSKYDEEPVKNHKVVIDDLPKDTEIYFEVISEGKTTAIDAYRVIRTQK